MAIRNRFLGTPQFNQYAVGTKQYGSTNSDAPTVGPVDKAGYRARDARRRNQRNSLRAALEDSLQGNRMSANVLRRAK